jgi:hypothetical protein
MTSHDALREAVVARAVRTRTRGWAEWGQREHEEWPLEFGYDTGDNRSRPWVFGGCLLAMLALCGVFLGYRLPGMVADVGWPLALGAALLIALLLLSLPPSMGLALLPSMLETRRRLEHTLLVDPEGIRYRRPEGELVARWDEVSEYFVGPAPGPVKLEGPSVVVTRAGTFDFLHTIRNPKALRAIIQRFATSARTQGWHAGEEERLGDDASCWTGSYRGVGQRVFHYRTRTNRALLWFAGGHWLAWTVSATIGPVRDQLATQPGAIVPGVVLTLGMLWLIWRYRTAAILLDHRGVSQRAWNGTRTLEWSEIEILTTSGTDSMHFGNVIGKGRRLRFWLYIADAAELQKILAARAPHAQQVNWSLTGLEG